MAAVIAASESGGAPAVPSLVSACCTSRVPAFAFSCSLLQAVLQACFGVSVSPLIPTLTTANGLLPKLEVEGSNPFARSNKGKFS